MQQYLAFGLVLSSSLDLPELVPAKGEADILVRFGVVELPAEPAPGHPCVLATATEAWFYYPGIGRFRVTDGKEILVDPHPGVEDVALRQTLLGSVLAMALQQRGLFVLHGSAAGLEDAAVAIVAESGYGKSTTAAALVGAGFSLLSDDIVAIRTEPHVSPHVLPGFPEINLWSDVKNPGEQENGRVIASGDDRTKRSYHIDEGFAATSIPLRRVYALRTGDEAGMTPVPPSAGLIRLFDYTFGPELLRFGPVERIFEQCADLVRTVPVRWLTRTRYLEDLPRLVEFILQDLQAEPGVKSA